MPVFNFKMSKIIEFVDVTLNNNIFILKCDKKRINRKGLDKLSIPTFKRKIDACLS